MLFSAIQIHNVVRPRSAPKIVKRSGNCIFCGSADLCGEHIWPQWAAPILGHKTYRGKRIEGFIVKTKKTQLVSRDFRERHGHTADKKIYVVCRKCNNTWMSAIEAKVKDIAIPMMRGNCIDLTSEMQTTLAEWVTLKVLVAENNKPDEAVFPQEARNAFWKDKTIPSCMSIWVGRCIEVPWRSVFIRQAALFGLDINEPPNAGRKNTQTTALGIGELFIFSMACVTEGVDLNNFFAFDSRIVPLWPIADNTLVWPPMKILSGQDATSIAFAMEKLILSPRTLWRGG